MSINRIRLEFKACCRRIIWLIGYRINRIRLEFKEELMLGTSLLLCCINRIRLEFKVIYPRIIQGLYQY